MNSIRISDFFKINKRIVIMLILSVSIFLTLILSNWFKFINNLISYFLYSLNNSRERQNYSYVLWFLWIIQLILFIGHCFYFIKEDKNKNVDSGVGCLDFNLKTSDWILLLTYILGCINIFGFYYIDEAIKQNALSNVICCSYIELIVYFIFIFVVFFKNIDKLFLLIIYIVIIIAGTLDNQTVGLLSFIIAAFGLLLDYDFLKKVYLKLRNSDMKYNIKLGLTSMKFSKLTKNQVDEIKFKVYKYKFIPGIIVGLYNIALYLSSLYEALLSLYHNDILSPDIYNYLIEIIMNVFYLGLIRFSIMALIFLIIIFIWKKVSPVRKIIFNVLHHIFDETIEIKSNE